MRNAERNPVARTFDVLYWLSQSGERDVGVRQLAGHLGVPSSSVQRVLKSLHGLGMLVQVESGRYRIGLPLFALANDIARHQPVWQFATDELARLVDLFDETALIGLYDPARRRLMFVNAIESTRPIRYVPPIDRSWLPLHAGSSGLAILAFLSNEEIREIIEGNPLPALTSATLTDPEQIWREIRVIRARGYAHSVEQRLPDAVGVAAPILYRPHQPLGDVIITFPVSRLGPAGPDIDHIGQELIASAARIAEAWDAGVARSGQGAAGRPAAGAAGDGAPDRSPAATRPARRR